MVAVALNLLMLYKVSLVHPFFKAFFPFFLPYNAFLEWGNFYAGQNLSSTTMRLIFSVFLLAICFEECPECRIIFWTWLIFEYCRIAAQILIIAL